MNWLWWKKRKKDCKGKYPSSPPYLSIKTGRRKRIPKVPPVKYYLPFSVLKATSVYFEKYGYRRVEAYAWWTGYLVNDQEAQICTAICPSVRSQYGHVYIDRKKLSTMHKHLIDIDQILLAELHTHPPNAGGQNKVDAANAASYYAGYKSTDL